MSRMSSQNRWVPARIRTEAPVLQFRKSAEVANRTGLREVVHRLLGFNRTTREVQLERHRNNEDKTDSVPYYVTLWCVRVTTVAMVTRLYIPFYYFNTCTVHPLLFCTMTNKCTIISQTVLPTSAFEYLCSLPRY